MTRAMARALSRSLSTSVPSRSQRTAPIAMAIDGLPHLNTAPRSGGARQVARLHLAPGARQTPPSLVAKRSLLATGDLHRRAEDVLAGAVAQAAQLGDP